ncbi:MAG: type II toxin-antitoxin system PemK/MazF family toxin [Candidatus Nomurabacteria bacterium]
MQEKKLQNTQKDSFDIWNSLKKDLNSSSKESAVFRTRDIWWTSLGKNVGFEEDGKNELFERPVLILKKWNASFFVGIPFTTKKIISEENSKFYHRYDLNDFEQGYAMLSQIRVFSSKRIQRRIKKMGEKDFEEVKKKLKEILLLEE